MTFNHQADLSVAKQYPKGQPVSNRPGDQARLWLDTSSDSERMSRCKKTLMISVLPFPAAVRNDMSMKYGDHQFFWVPMLNDLNIDRFPDLLEYTDMLKDIVKQQHVTGVVSRLDLETLVHAALSEEFPHISGPTVESCFLALHKFYSRTVLDPNPIPCEALDLDSPTLEEDANLPYRGWDYIKGALTGAKFNPYNPSIHLLRNFVVRYLDTKKYPLALRQVIVLEKYVDVKMKVTVDGYVHKGKVNHLLTTESVYFPSRWDNAAGCYHPCRATAQVKDDIVKTFVKVVEGMTALGFDNQVLHGEFFVKSSGAPSLIEINVGRLGLSHLQVCLRQGDPVRLQLQLVSGEGVDLLRVGECPVFLGYIVPRSSGPATDYIDFDKVDEISREQGVHVVMKVDKDDQITMLGQGGGLGDYVARVVIRGLSYEESVEKFKRFSKQILKKQEWYAWL
uniref:ATP-grasp domain-containing protein n=1 Tax=Branchiostoma floridae TaxID=7739 RepID=C3XTY2_BRAFL|eukprot:XP_002612347.1 hypothetical protein BRAFLDRAFT_80018 [Branchiostoma floridae]